MKNISRPQSWMGAVLSAHATCGAVSGILPGVYFAAVFSLAPLLHEGVWAG